MRLNELMNKNVEVISPEATVEEAWNRMEQKAIRHLVVMSDGTVEGILSQRDIGGKRGLRQWANDPVSDLMSPHTVTGKPDMSVSQAANLMRGHVIGCLPIVENGKLKGIITVSDLLEVIGRGQQKPVVRTERAMLSRRQGRRQKGHA